MIAHSGAFDKHGVGGIGIAALYRIIFRNGWISFTQNRFESIVQNITTFDPASVIIYH